MRRGSALAVGAALVVCLGVWPVTVRAEDGDDDPLTSGQEASPPGLVTYAVQPGDTVSDIALRNEMSVDELLALNPQIGDPDRIFPDQRLQLPAREPELPAWAETEAADEVACDLVEVLEEEGVALPIQRPEPAEPPAELVFLDLVDREFASAVVEVARRLEMDPNHLMAIMHFETGGTFDPAIRNPYTRAVGLIQFLPSTARILGTTDEALAEMTAVEQLGWVERYLSPFTGRLTTLDDAYMAVLYPAAVGASPDFVLFRSGTATFDRNPGLDRDGDGLVTRGEAGELIRRVLRRGRGEPDAGAEPGA